MKKQQCQQIEQHWERAIERAQENQPRDQAFDKQALNHAAGLHIQSGVKAGGWRNISFTYEISCGCE